MSCPNFLPEDITSGEASSFLHALSSTTADNVLATSDCERFRFWLSVISVILFALKNHAMSCVDQIRMPPDESAYTLWNATIGDALSAVPQADMVSLK